MCNEKIYIKNVSDYLNKIYIEKKIRTPVCFFDETGLLNNSVDKFFILGMIKCLRPYKLCNFVQRLRDKAHFYDEIKWKKVNAKNLGIMKRLIDAFFATYNTSFYCIVLHKSNMDFEKYFDNDFFKVYLSFTTLLLKNSIRNDEIMSVIADRYSTPGKDEFEAKVRNYVNDHSQRMSIHSVVRIHSVGSDLIQIADLLMGAVNYEFKLKNKLIENPSAAKTQLLGYLKEILKSDDLTRYIESEKFNVMIFDPKKRT